MTDYTFTALLLQVGDFIGDVFEFGFWVAVILMGMVGAGGYWLYRKFKKR